MTKIDKKLERLETLLAEVPSWRLFEINNEITEEYDYDKIYEMKDVNEVLSDFSPIFLIRLGQGRDFNLSDKYFVIGKDYILSDNKIARLIDLDNIADYCIENNRDFGIKEIRNILNSTGEDGLPVDIEDAIEISFHSNELEGLLPTSMSYKEASIVNGNQIYWITQGIFKVEELKELQRILREYYKNIKKFYITYRGISSFNFKKDYKDDILAVVTPTKIVSESYVQAIKNAGLDDYLKEEVDLDKLEEFFNEHDVVVNEVESSENDSQINWELEWFSPAGENLCDQLVCKNDFAAIKHCLYELYDSFDTEEHVTMWINAECNGVPDIKTLVKDADDIKAKYDELFKDLCYEDIKREG